MDFKNIGQSLVKEYVGKRRNGADDEYVDAITNQVNILHLVVVYVDALLFRYVCFQNANINKENRFAG